VSVDRSRRFSLIERHSSMDKVYELVSHIVVLLLLSGILISVLIASQP